MPYSGVEGWRSHCGDFLDEAMGTMDGDEAGGEGVQSADREQMDQHDTTGFGGCNGAVAMTPRGGTRILKG